MKVLCISAHPDDETLGCGGTLLKHAGDGDALYWLIATRAYEPVWSKEKIEAKKKEVEAVAGAYGMVSTDWLNHRATQLDRVDLDALIAEIRRVVEKVNPDIVYTVHAGDVHSDHRTLFAAVMSVLKPFYLRDLGVRRILSFETLSSTEGGGLPAFAPFNPNVFNDISEQIDEKLRVMALYESEIQAEPQPRSPSAIRALARYRGAGIGVGHAESFMLIREIS